MTIDWNVKNAVNRDVERQHLNKILADIRASIDSLNRITQNPKTDVQSIVGAMVEGNTEKGIDVSYNANKKVLDFVLTQFALNLTGDVTGTATITGDGDVTLDTELNPAIGVLTPAPIDGSPYWQLAGQWDYVGTILETLYYLDEPGIVAITDDLEAVVREIEGTAGEIVVTDGTGAAANPVISLADVTDSNTGTLQGITVDGKGRVTGTTDATITAGAGIDVVNGDAAAGPPTISHEDTSSVSNLSSDNSGTIVLQDIAFTFDTFGHVQTASVSTVDAATALASTFQPLDATLTALAAANWVVNAIPIGTGADTVSQVSFAVNTFPARASTGNLVAKPITDFALTLVDDATALSARGTLEESEGNYTPTPVGVLNVASSTGHITNYIKQGKYVSISGRIAVVVSAVNTITAVDINLPVATVFATNADSSGCGTVNKGTNYISGAFIGSVAATAAMRIVFMSDPLGLGTHDIRFNAIYPILP